MLDLDIRFLFDVLPVGDDVFSSSFFYIMFDRIIRGTTVLFQNLTAHCVETLTLCVCFVALRKKLLRRSY